MDAAPATDRMTKTGISPQSRRHNDMRRAAVRAHPQLKGLAGTAPWTALALPALFGLQWGMAWLVSDAGLLVIFLAAFLFGQVVIHSAGALLHESAHRLIVRGDRAKLAFDLGLEAIMTSYGKQLTYQHEHVSSHHPYMGNYEKDYEHEDICAFQARQVLKSSNPRLQRAMTVLTLLIHALPLGFLIGDLVLPRLNAWLSGQPVKDKARHIGATKPPVWQVRLFIAASLASNLAMLALLGPWALLYHVWSLSLFLGKCGVLNLGQSLSEHAGSDEINPTRSTYGPINWLLFNTGYHSEHHSFPAVPWTRLPVLRREAPEIFNTEAERTYVGYWWEHVRNDFTASRHNPLQDRDNSQRCRTGVA
ncbi:MAG: fatty acid desaturase [Rhizobiaceae bacterium]